ncbi:hypothetical protein AG0111_0g4729 [Alternaria gaisen]|uniref:Uncharacterized protein n=1 Tax=Alternaria gaisen TaxID=167740 RepID=A0ACB6FRQ8_9PLEO|nr:hypothetical protein AG0111_0g4729 [Alternaria gaisen]
MNNLDATKNASVNTWESSDCTNHLSLHHIIATNFPTAKSAWEDYMELCLDQLYRKARYVLILHRTPVKDSYGTFGAVTMFSGLHRAWRLQEPTTPGFVSIRYIVFGGGSQQQKEICHNVVSQHLETLQSSEGEMRDRVVSRVLEVFAQATQLWANPMLSLRAELLVDGKVLRAWPSSRYEIDYTTA